jgi:NADPH:quinone reductase-like Zn-dependent oxidoreductase
VFRFVQIHEFGDASVLRIEDVEVGEPDSGEARLRIHAIGLNRTEIGLRSGRSPASAVIATTEQDVVAEVKGLTSGKGAELVFDPVGGPEFANLAKATAAGGTLVLYGALDTRPTVVPPFDIFGRDLAVPGFALTASTRDDAKPAALKQFVSVGLADGAFHPAITRTFPFEPIADAHRCMEAGEQVGKIVVAL